jgi:23S rRNA (pseudouridine1915-N3)-methyltransferase
MKIKLICPDQDKSRLYADMINEYAKRLPWKLEIIDLTSAHSDNVNQRLERESIAIKKKISNNDFVIILDAKGKQLDSEGFAYKINELQQSARNEIAFVIGGAYGLSEELKSRADLLLSFGKMTMTHRLVKLVLMEQIYRAFTIISGHPYHK